MSDTRFETVLLRDILGYSSSFTSKTTEIRLKSLGMHILEMEDVLFHLNSAVMMPESPSGKSSADGVASDGPGGDLGDDFQEDQQTVTGIKALALVFKQFELDPKVQMVIAGHTDTSGKPKFNFKLSEERAQNVLYLLTGEKEPWAEVSEGRQKIEDYQQIMRCYALKKGWACDPEKVDDKWGDKTKKACREFFKQALPGSPDDSDEIKGARADALVAEVQSDSKKRWPKRAWEAVFDLYVEDLCKFLDMETEGFKEYANATIKYIDDTRKYVACGESFPIDDREKKNYRSQVNRRVEIVFFDEDEKPVLDCPVTVDTVHKEEECPLWDKTCYLPLYIDPLDIYAVIYHLRFVYYDRVKDRIMSVPEGLTIKAYQKMEGMVEDELLPTETIFMDGVYYTKVQFTSELKDPARKVMYFQFEGLDEFGKRRWIYTANKDAEPVIAGKFPPEYDALSFEEKWKHYDLPDLWSSRNYWTRYDGDINKGERFEKVLKELKSLKPFGDNKTVAEKPLTFSLDDIVLLDAIGGTQDIKDMNHEIPPANKDLSNKSRMKILMVDQTTGFLKLYRTDETKKSSARIPFLRNLINEDPEKIKLARVIHFRDGFYTIADKRTKVSADWADKGFVVGARAALRGDNDYHASMMMSYWNNEKSSTGDYELHYFHNRYIDGKHPVSFMVVYVSISFMIDSRSQPPNPPPPKPSYEPIPSNADVKKFVDEGVYNAMDHWNRKRYFLKETTDSEDSTIIRHFYLFDERETFNVPDPKPTGIDFDKRPSEDAASNFRILFTNAKVSTARSNALGGKSKYLAMVCRDESTHYGPAYQWGIRNEGEIYSLFKLNRSAYKEWNDIFASTFPLTEHGETFHGNTFAHELGHGTGNPDEYIKKSYKPDPADSYKAPDFDQFFIPYSMEKNEPSMMYHNGGPRLHHIWYHIFNLNEGIKDPISPLSRMLSGKSFVGRLDRGTWQITYTRHIDAATATHHSVPRKLIEAMHHDKAYSFSASPPKTINLALHDVGKDESSIKYFHANQDSPTPIQYQAVLVVRVLLNVKFSGAWTDEKKGIRINAVDQAWTDQGGQYRLINGPKDIKNIYIHFMPGFSDNHDHNKRNPNTPLTDRNYEVNFSDNNSSTLGGKIINIGGKLTVAKDNSGDELVNYILNKTPGTTWLTALGFLKTWIDSKLGGSFTLQKF